MLAFLLMLLWFIASLLVRWRFRALLVLSIVMAMPCVWLVVVFLFWLLPRFTWFLKGQFAFIPMAAVGAIVLLHALVFHQPALPVALPIQHPLIADYVRGRGTGVWLAGGRNERGEKATGGGGGD